MITSSKRRRSLVLGFLLSLACISSASAHESRPAYLEVKESSTGVFDVLWRTPLLSGMPLPVVLKLPQGLKDVRPVTTEQLADSVLERHTVTGGSDGLSGKRIDFPGLQATITDVLIRAELLGGKEWTTIVHPSQPWVEISAEQSRWQIVIAFIQLGIEHILTGIDHLLFILALIIITGGGWKLVKTITGFTISHSITLTAATLGYVHVPQRPVEAVIALSIVFVACEIVRRGQGRTGLTERWPWVVALTFGLLHGLGFAGALSEVGLPAAHIPLALLFFSTGVEVGQLLFVGSILSLLAIVIYGVKTFRPSELATPWSYAWCENLAAYSIGGVASFWLIERTLSFVF